MMKQDAGVAPHYALACVLLIAVQAMLLYVPALLDAAGPFSNLHVRLPWYTCAMVVPAAMALTLRCMRTVWPIWHVAVLVSALAAMAAWTSWNFGMSSMGLPQSALLTLLVCVPVATVVALPWWQLRLRDGAWSLSPADWNRLFWGNLLSLAFALALAVLGVAVLHWFATQLESSLLLDLKQDERTLLGLTSTLFVLGILLIDQWPRLHGQAGRALLAIGGWLLPLGSLGALLGLPALLGARDLTPAPPLMLALAGGILLLTNTIPHEGSPARAYPGWVRALVTCCLLVLPLYPGSALLTFVTDVQRHGWNEARVGWVVLSALLTVSSIGYAMAALQRPPHWLKGVFPVNCAAALLTLVLTILLCTPALHPLRMTLSSQVRDLSVHPDNIESSVLAEMRFTGGGIGMDALLALQRAPAVRANPRAITNVRRALAVTTTWDDAPYVRYRGFADLPPDIATYSTYFELSADSPALPADWWQALRDGTIASNCMDGNTYCLVTHGDLDHDGRDDILQCDSQGDACALYTRGVAAGWYVQAETAFSLHPVHPDAVKQLDVRGPLRLLPGTPLRARSDNRSWVLNGFVLSEEMVMEMRSSKPRVPGQCDKNDEH